MQTLRELFGRLSVDGEILHELRRFNLAPRVNNKAASVKELAERLGFSVCQVDLPRNLAGRLVQDPFSENGYCIEVNAKHSVQSRRFAVLHEMGHYFLHADHSDPIADPLHLERGDTAFYVDTRQEREANMFAAVLLFGDSSLSAARSLYRDDVAKLSRHFGVSEQTIRIAMKQFK